MWLGTGTSGRLCEQSAQTSGSIKYEEFDYLTVQSVCQEVLCSMELVINIGILDNLCLCLTHFETLTCFGRVTLLNQITKNGRDAVNYARIHYNAPYC
jgi:hypothetical protein